MCRVDLRFNLLSMPGKYEEFKNPRGWNETILTRRCSSPAVVSGDSFKLLGMLGRTSLFQQPNIDASTHTERMRNKMAPWFCTVTMPNYTAFAHAQSILIELISCAFLETLDHFTTIPGGGMKDPSPELLFQAGKAEHMFSCWFK